MNWKQTTLSELENLQKCALNNNFFANNYSAVNSILYEKKFHSQIAMEDGWIFERYMEDKKTYYSFPHNIDGDISKIEEAIGKLKKETQSEGLPLLFQNITLDEKEALLKIFPFAKVTETPESGDYIYLTEKLSTLAGKKYSRKRNHIHQFQNKHADYRFELLDESNIRDAYTIEEKWLSENSETAAENGTLSDLEIEKEIISFALDNFKHFSATCGMTGGILYIEGNAAAFCIASTLSSKVTDIHFEKCLSSFGRDGGYAVINNEFAKTVQTEFINREEDLGIEGLRKAKLSYFPERVLEKFSVNV